MYNPYLEHSGVKGMHWGVRRYQNHDGSLTPAGRAHYGVGPARKVKTTVGAALKKVKKGAKAVSKSMGSTLKKIKTKRAEGRVKREERREERLEKAIAKGNVNKILKGLDRMSDRELNDALNRARNVKALKDLKAPKKSLSERLGDVAVTVNKGAIAVQNIAKARKERLDYRKAKDQYDREEEARAKKEREEWEKEHANDPKFSDRFKNALKGAKDLNASIKSKIDNWEPYDTNEKRPPKKETYDRNYDEEWTPKGNTLGSALKRLGGSTSTKQITGPSYTPNFKLGKNVQPAEARAIAGLLPDLSKPKSSPKKSTSSYEKNLMSDILEMTKRRSGSSGGGITVDPEELARGLSKKNKKKLRQMGYL